MLLLMMSLWLILFIDVVVDISVVGGGGDRGGVAVLVINDVVNLSLECH